jgi:hypothetical protein
MRRLSASLCLIVALTGCSANWHLKRAIAKDPTILTTQVIHDTITVVTPELRVDTVHQFSSDTVTTIVDRVKIRTKVDTINRTVFVDVTCPGDTIYVPYEKTINTIKYERKNHALPWLLLAAAVTLLIIALRYRR